MPLPGSTLCPHCGKTFSNKNNLKKHVKNVHGVEWTNEDNTIFKCHDCHISLSSESSLRAHLEAQHEFDSNLEKMIFNTYNSFAEWLHEEEYKENVQYVRSAGKKTFGQNVENIYFQCSRSGRVPVAPEHRQRKEKSQGSCKINSWCTSRIIVSHKEGMNEWHVKYYKTHYGHKKEIQHIRIAKIDKESIASKLILEVPTTSVLNSIRESIHEECLHRIDIATRKDISNIKRSYNIDIKDGCRHADDSTSVNLWVEECCSNENNNPIIFYKKQGEEHSSLEKQDFCLILMNSVQKELLVKFGTNIVCVDSTHGLNCYDFEMTTVLVLDEFNEGFPIACMFTNKKDTHINELFFSKIRDNAGQVIPKTFMTDITNVFYNAWCTVMGPPGQQLFCSWHVDRAWQHNLNKVTDTENRKFVYKTLKFLQTQIDEETFINQYASFITLLNSDDTTVAMGEYLTKNYSNITEKWAYAFRKKCGISTNMHIESMHKVIKYVYLDGKKIKRLDKALHVLQIFIRDKIFERIIKLTKGKNTKHIQIITNNHHLALKQKYDVTVQGNNFIVHSNNKDTYIVSKNKDVSACCQLKCPLCKICIHAYECTCVEYNIRYKICKHIHYVSLLKKTNNEAEGGEPSDVMDLVREVTVKKKTSSNIIEEIKKSALQIICNVESTELSEENLSLILKNLKTTASLTSLPSTSTSSLKLEAGEESLREPPNKKIKKQNTFYSTKTNRSKKTNMKKPNNGEKVYISEILSSSLCPGT